MQRRTFIAGVLAVPFLGTAPDAADLPRIAIAKSPSCGCCGAWVDHLRAVGFEAEVREIEQPALNALKAELGIAPDHASCHTATVEGYFVEGHVPADDIRRLLAEGPEARGLAVPGMPDGSPGMEMGDTRNPFDTLLVGKDGKASVFASH